MPQKTVTTVPAGPIGNATPGGLYFSHARMAIESAPKLQSTTAHTMPQNTAHSIHQGVTR
ncbi:hypothetical protein [Leptolyngbya sp. 7M]|uniref:hypothetical protein n=1 Tax=Leptolyngbya sp. 7M TaxID=2812896 RepID=UPI001B8D0A74|nr:hypothetical protein [Leptolyngbya sp. 7M]QYO63741.1 hypothetical protein JVX88_28430 [Leptolyngbya sp. 7M]